MAAREGGGDPDMNPTLRTMFQKARDASVPLDTIERAIKRGTGELEGVTYEQITYEGYAPGGVAMLIEVLTDNRNRTGSDVRSLFTKRGGSMAEPGAVSWQFERKGTVLVDRAADEDELMLLALDAGAEDVVDDGEAWRLVTPPTDLHAVRTAVEEAGMTDRVGRPHDGRLEPHPARGHRHGQAGARPHRRPRGPRRRAGGPRQLRHLRRPPRSRHRLTPNPEIGALASASAPDAPISQGGNLPETDEGDAPAVELPALAGWTVGVTADRRREEQAELLGRRGAKVVHGPTVRTLPVELGDGLEAATAALIERPPDIVVLHTGLGRGPGSRRPRAPGRTGRCWLRSSGRR